MTKQEWSAFFLKMSRDYVRACWYLIAFAAIALALAWYLYEGEDDNGGHDKWVEISPNGNGGDIVNAKEVVKESVLT